jgi:pyruvate formate lyase activating enzyme
MIGNIYSIEPLATFDGPGLRMVVFFQGCGFKCIYCHNRDTWEFSTKNLMSASDIIKIYHSYANFYKNGGITLSGGEPLLQMDFVLELLTLCKRENIHVCVDTSAQNFNLSNEAFFEKLMPLVDIFLLDIKHINNDSHKIITGYPNNNVLDFLNFLSARQKETIIRYVLVKGFSDNLDDIYELKKYLSKYNNIIKVDVLPLNLLGASKWSLLGLKYLLNESNLVSSEEVLRVSNILNSK